MTLVYIRETLSNGNNWLNKLMCPLSGGGGGGGFYIEEELCIFTFPYLYSHLARNSSMY